MAGDIRLPDIKASVKVDSKDVDAGLNRVQASTRSAGKGFEGLQTSARGAIDNLSSSLSSKLGPASVGAESALSKLSSVGSMMGPAIAGGAAAAGVAVGKFALDAAQEFVALAGEIRNFQRASGASAEDSSRFVAVLDDLGVSSETAGSALFKLGRNAASGGTDLSKFGVEIAKSKDGTTDLTETMLNVADAYVQTTDPAKRAELAFAAFGKQGQALIPVLEQGRAGLDAFFKGVKPGELMSDADLQKAREFELAIDDLQDSLREVRLEGGQALVPFLTDLASGGAKLATFGQEVDGKVSGALSKLAQIASNAAGGPLSGLVQSLASLGGKSGETAAKQLEMANKMDAATASIKAQSAASIERAAALDRVRMATLSSLSSQLGYQASVNTLKDNINDLDDKTQAYTEAVNTNGASSKEAEAANRALRDAHLGIEQSALSAAGAAVRLAEDTAASKGETLTATEKSAIFKGELQALATQASGPTADAILALANQIADVPDSKTVSIYADTSAARAAIASLRRELNSIEAGASSTSGAQQFALGMDMGPVKGRPGQAVPIIAHAGEWVVTPAQLADLRNSPSPGVPSATATGQAIDYDRLAAAIAAHPPRAYVVASDVAKGLHDNRRR